MATARSIEPLESRRLMADHGVTAFGIGNADTDAILLAGQTGEISVPLDAPTHIAVVASVKGATESIKFTGKRTQIENYAPYCLHGDTNGDLHGELASPGDVWNVTAQGYSADGALGIAGDSASVTIRFVAGEQPPPRGNDRPQPPSSFSAPLTITQGGTYSGNWQGIVIKTTEPVLIQNTNLKGKSDLIRSDTSGARITLRNVNGWGENPNVYGKSPGRFLYAFSFASADVEGCYMEGTRGIVLNGNKASGTVRIIDNWGWNIDGRLSDGDGGYQGGGVHKRAQFINLDKVQNVPGIEIAWNQVVNELGKSRVEDNIALYQSSGTPSSPIRIHDNYIQGAYNADPANDTNYAGGGILLGDGHVGSAYAEAYNNTVISTTNYGIAISGGHDQSFWGNRIVSSGLLADGRRIAAQNVGAYVWDYHNAGAGFYNNGGRENLIGWMRGTSRNDWWVPDADYWTNNTRWPSNPTLADEAAERDLWLTKLGGRPT